MSSARLRLYDLRVSEFPLTNGLCRTDVASIAALANRVERRLLYCMEAGEESWWGTWAEVAFQGVSCLNPFVTTPRSIARIEAFNICRRPVMVRNQFMEYLQFGNGRLPKLRPHNNWGVMDSFTRNNAITFVDLPAPPQLVAIYTTDLGDVQAGRRVLLQGKDQNGNTIYSQSDNGLVQGEYVYCATPFATSAYRYSRITGIQKDQTQGSLQFMAIDSGTGAQSLFHAMEPSEEVANYRRYYLHNIPRSCCTLPNGEPPQNLDVLAIAKLEHIPVQVDQDYLVLQNLEAFIEEAKAVHFSDMEETSAKAQALMHHTQAVRLLNGELTHYLGKNRPSVNFAPFGTARLERVNIGMI